MKLVYIFKLDQESYRFGTVFLFDIQRDNYGKKLYGYAQFEKKEDADNLIKTIMIQLITQQGKQLELHINRNQLKITRQSQKIIKSKNQNRQKSIQIFENNNEVQIQVFIIN